MENTSIKELNILKSYPRYAGLTTLICHEVYYKLWLITQCLNIYVDKDKSELFFGENRQDKYEMWKNCPFLIVDNIVMYDDVKEDWKVLLNNNQSIYAMIDTEIAGISEGKQFFHDVLITGYEDESFFVWDFFPPNYIWRKKRIAANKITEAYSKCETRKFDGFFVIKENTEPFFDEKEIKNTLIDVNTKCISDTFYWISNRLKYTTSNNYDFAYVQFVCDYIQILSYLEEYLLKEKGGYICKAYEECIYIKNYYLKCVLKNDKNGFEIVSEKILKISERCIEFIKNMQDCV